MEKRIGIGIIGCGTISANHLKAVADLDHAEAVAAADINGRALEERAAEFGIPALYEDWNELLENDDVDAVCICLPHNLHCRCAVDAARRGKHVLVEKPMAISLKECDEMIRAAEENGTVLMVAQVLRRYQAHTTAKSLIREGRIGRIYSVVRRRMSYGKENLDRYPWASKPEIAGGWLLYGFGAHEFDAILWLMDTKAETVMAMGGMNEACWNDYDEIISVMRLENGAVATMIHSLNSRNGCWDCTIVGSKGTMTVTNRSIVLNGEEIKVEHDGAAGFRAQMKEFVDSIVNGSEPGPSGRNVRATMQVLEGVKISLNERRIVDVNEL